MDSIDVVDFALGKEKHVDDLNVDQILMFSNQNLDINYAGSNENGIRLRVNNKLDKTVAMVINDPVKINEKEFSNTFISSRYLPPHSISDYYIRVMDFNPDYVPEKIESFIFDGYTHIGTMVDEFTISPDTVVDQFLDSSDSSVEKQNDKDVTTTEEMISTEVASNIVESSYNDACTLTEEKLEKKYSSFLDKTNYYYKGLIIQSEDLENLDVAWNTEKVLNQGALYRTMAMYLEGFSIGLNNGSDYSELLCGQQWKDKSSIVVQLSRQKSKIFIMN